MSDRFDRLFGSARGTTRGDLSAEPWWREDAVGIDSPPSPQAGCVGLATWFDELWLEGDGYDRLWLIETATVTCTVAGAWCSDRARAAGLPGRGRIIDAHEYAWVLRHWPVALREQPRPGFTTGRLA